MVSSGLCKNMRSQFYPDLASLSLPKHQNQTLSKIRHSRSLPHLNKGHILQYFNTFFFADNISWRTDRYGSLFIHQLISHFKEYSWCYHLEEIFRKVGRDLLVLLILCPRKFCRTICKTFSGILKLLIPLDASSCTPSLFKEEVFEVIHRTNVSFSDSDSLAHSGNAFEGISSFVSALYPRKS